MFRCGGCGCVFADDEVQYERVCWEDYYGVGGMFDSRNYGDLMTCPHCGSDDIEELDEEDEEEDE